MKRYGGISLAVAAILLVVLVFGSPMDTNAATCANTSTYGAVRLSIPELPRAGDYVLWVRMQSPDTTAKVLVEVNEEKCLEVASAALPAAQWSWVTSRSSGSVSTVRFATTKGNSLRLIGIQQGVKVDRVLLSKPDCLPEEFGNNCSELIEVSMSVNSSVASLSPPSTQPVSGKVELSSTPTRNQASLVSVSYTVNGDTVQKSAKPDPFDTTLVDDGKYTVIIETTLKKGSVIRESTVIVVDNPTNPLSPIIRWLRLNQRSLQVIGGSFATILVSLVLIATLKRWYIKRRERHFHGF